MHDLTRIILLGFLIRFDYDACRGQKSLPAAEEDRGRPTWHVEYVGPLLLDHIQVKILLTPSASL